MMKLRRWGVPVLLLVAGLALWLLLAGPSQLLGLDTDKAGMALLVTAAWVLLFAALSLPRRDLDRAASPGPWKAWRGAVFMRSDERGGGTECVSECNSRWSPPIKKKKNNTPTYI